VCKFGEAVGVEIINTISPYLKAASEDAKWRVRVEAIGATVSLALTYQVLAFET
jgi:serine/threonine-protein phosphatase 2A regulatory subunit A